MLPSHFPKARNNKVRPRDHSSVDFGKLSVLPDNIINKIPTPPTPRQADAKEQARNKVDRGKKRGMQRFNLAQCEPSLAFDMTLGHTLAEKLQAPLG